MSAKTLRQKLHHYIDHVHEAKLRAIFAIVEDEIETGDYWKDEAFVNELAKRENAYLNGRAGAVSLKKSAQRVKEIISKVK